MSQRRWITVAVGLLAVGAIVATPRSWKDLVRALAYSETLFEGWPASYWGRELDYGDEQAKFVALNVLQDAGADGRGAVDALIRLLGDANPRLRSRACSALAGIGSEARDAYPKLSMLLCEDANASVRREARLAIARIEPSRLVAALTAALDSPDADIRAATANDLTSAGIISSFAIERLERVVLEDENARVRRAAASALELILLQQPKNAMSMHLSE